MKSCTTLARKALLYVSLALFLGCGVKPGLDAEPVQAWTPVTATAPPAELMDACTKDSFHIDLAQMVDVQSSHDPDDRAEQWRDMLFPILLARLESRDGLEGLLVSVASSPLIRDDALAHVLDQAVGSTRTAVAKNGTVVVLVEDGDPAVVHDALLEAIDQEALHLAGTPGQTIAYRYALDEASGYAQICHLATFEAGALESEAENFRRATISTQRELRDFLAGGVDLSSAQCSKDGLEVTGRVRPRASLAPITAEHIAALHRPRQLEYVPISELYDYLPKPSDELARWLGKMSQLIERPRLMKLPEFASRLDGETTEMLEAAIRWKRKHRKVPTHELVLSWVGQKNDPRRLGFSLDPKMRAEDAARSMAALRDASDDPRELAALLYAWDVSARKATTLVRSLDEIGGTRELYDKAFSEMHGMLREKNVDAFGTLTKWQSATGELGDNLVATAVGLVYEHAGYQCARYDGPLQGTQVGMTMFYTDLLMKLWSGDQFDSAPDGIIPGFESVVGHDLSEAHCTEEEEEEQYSNTRAWLGLRDEQYAREGEGRVRFAPIVARVFARSSQYGAEYSEEIEATAAMRRFYRWWNDHYAQIAAWEPQYELLNQIMKWSVVVQSAELSEHRDCLGFLEDIEVRRDHRFDEWVSGNEDLRWRGPVSLVHAAHETTECIPLLRSRTYERCGREFSLVGGVSVASRMLIKAKPVRRAPSYRPVSRLDARATKPPQVAGDGSSVVYESVSKANGTLHDIRVDLKQKSVSAEIDLAQTQRGKSHSYHVGGKSKAQPVRQVAQTRRVDNGRLVAHDTVNKRFGVAQLETGDVTGPRVKAQVKRLEIAQMRELGEDTAVRLARSGKKPLSKVVADIPHVGKAWKVDENTVVVRIADAGGGPPKYGVMSSGGGIRGPPQGALRARFGQPGGSVELAIIDRGAAKPLIAKALAIEPSENARRLSEVGTALQRGNLAEVEAIIDALSENAPSELGTIQRLIRRARMNAARLGQDTSGLDALALSVDIKHGRPGRSVLETDVLPVDADAIYVPKKRAKEYAELTSLPPGTRPDGAAGMPRRRFHARVVAESSRHERLPAALGDGGDEYVRITLDAHDERPWTRALGLPSRRTYVIDECRDDETEQTEGVPCHGRTEGRDKDAAYRDYLLREACELGAAAAAKEGVEGCGVASQP